MTSDVDKKLREVIESIPSEKFDEMMCSRFKCFYCREPSSCLATFEEEGREIWRYVCAVCYGLLENDDREGLIKRLDEKGIVVCEAYYPKNPTKRVFIFRNKKELEKS